ncbi:MAG: 50S ribosomal protein L3 N(5)-glutamine methyltransferase [Leptothrix sp. (in: Bacteria)]|nr:50S ribosomal protein L3 N(5)-glutamine methyltransferase [Leptothrix sp. (in: b-proteobacteria)]
MTVLQLVQAEAALLAAGVHFGHGTTNAWDEAAWLVLWRLGLPLDALDAVATQDVAPVQAAQVRALVAERIATRKPAAYLTGEAWLQGVPFFVDERCIVPRSLIAEPLAEGHIDIWLSERTHRVLDLCTGNGSLAVLAALAWPEVTVDATDLSADALAVAARNVQRHGLADRIELLQGDGLAAVAGRRYDLILCNPPYVNRAAMAALPPEYRAEPALALDGNAAGGDDGMDFIRKLLAGAPHHLTDDAVLVLEVGHERPHFEAAFPTLEVVWLSTSAGDEQVLLITAQALRQHAGQAIENP